jgi:hypothetical protein
MGGPLIGRLGLIHVAAIVRSAMLDDLCAEIDRVHPLFAAYIRRDLPGGVGDPVG